MYISHASLDMSEDHNDLTIWPLTSGIRRGLAGAAASQDCVCVCVKNKSFTNTVIPF